MHLNDYWQWEKGRANAISALRNFGNSNENCINATKWLIVEKLNFDITTSKQKLSYKHFKDNNMPSLYDKHAMPRLIEMVEDGSSEYNFSSTFHLISP